MWSWKSSGWDAQDPHDHTLVSFTFDHSPSQWIIYKALRLAMHTKIFVNHGFLTGIWQESNSTKYYCFIEVAYFLVDFHNFAAYKHFQIFPVKYENC